MSSHRNLVEYPSRHCIGPCGFHQSMREQRPPFLAARWNSCSADVSRSEPVMPAREDPFHDASLRRRLERGDGFVFDADTGTGWASRDIVRDGNHIADLYVALELKPLIEERRTLRANLLAATVLSGIGGAMIGFLIVRRMVSPVRLLAERLRRAQAACRPSRRRYEFAA